MVIRSECDYKIKMSSILDDASALLVEVPFYIVIRKLESRLSCIPMKLFKMSVINKGEKWKLTDATPFLNGIRRRKPSI